MENVIAQTCSSNFTVKTVSTPSTCQANGSVTVTLEGELANISNVQYGLSSTNGFTINPQENNVLSNVPAGTYTVTVRAFCSVDNDFSAVKTLTGVTVGGNYKVPSVSFISTSSRKSYEKCNTGIIALNVTNGSGNFTFNIKTAPVGSPTGIVTPTKNGTLYTLPGSSYPAGDYVVEIDDGCYKSVATFTLGEVTGFPTFSYTSQSGFRPTLVTNSCNSINWVAGAVYSDNPDYYRYYQDGMYEVGAAPAGEMPTNWTPWTTSTLTLNIFPYTYVDFYTPKTISIYTRIKGCSNSYTSLTTYIKNPTMTSSVSYGCDKYSYTVKPWTDYDGLLCYPLSLVVTQTTGAGAGTVIVNKSNLAHPVEQQLSLDYDITYRIVMTDANGTVMTRDVTPTRPGIVTSYTHKCGSQYSLSYYTSYSCYPVEVTIKNSQGTVIHTNTLTTGASTVLDLDYGVSYTLEAVYTGINISPLYKYTTTIKTNPSIPTAYTMSLSTSTSSYCYEDYGSFYIYGGGLYFPIGTTFTITGPQGYTPQTYTTTSAYEYYYNMPNTTMPAGLYTLTTVSGCGDTKVSTFNHAGVYSGKQMSYTTESTCSGMKVTPTGYMTYQGKSTTTYYRLFEGPGGYDKSVISPGGSYTLSIPGRYVLGILGTNSSSGCVIKKDTINYTAPPLALDMSGTGAYECTDNVTGIILLRGVNGIAPYTYQLWNKNNTVRLIAADSISSGQVHFNYGRADSTYTVRVIDKCGNMFSQQVTLAKLSTARIVYSNPASVCTGETINLKCITLGNTAYNWTGPNGYEVSEQNPQISNAQANMTGWYKVTVLPEFCGDPVVDSTYVVVYAPLSAGAVSGVQSVCVRTVAGALGCSITGGSGAYTYQWQSSINGASNWTNISGATSATFLPPSQIQSQTNYYRVVVTDRCGTVNSNVISVNYKPCYLPVNPNIRSQAGS